MTDVASGLHELFRLQVQRTPRALATVDGDTRKSYRLLDDETDMLARWLVDHGIVSGDRVAILMETCADYVIACLATLKAGAAFLPLNPDYPDALLARILRQARPGVVLSRTAYLSRLPAAIAGACLAVDQVQEWQEGGQESPPVVPISPEHPAFIPYTSGSTGQPKGVVQTHRAAISSYLARYQVSSYQVGDRVGSNIFFFWEFMRPLLQGGTCYIIPDDVIRLPRALLAYIQEHQLAETLLTPSLLHSVMNGVEPNVLRESLQSLRVLWLNGEIVSVDLARQAIALLPRHTRLFNTYSISECHDVATIDLRKILLEDGDVCPVGAAMDGVVARVLPGEDADPAPHGSGELYVGGDGLALGYLNNEELTAEKFKVVDGQRFYATGDLATLDEDGQITIRGRCDSMVKIRGYSVYLTGVEEALRRYCGVMEAVAAVEGQEDSSKRLVAYVVRQPGASWAVDPRTGVSRQLTDLLSRHVPPFMVPARYVDMESIPIDWRTGKLDRRALTRAGDTSGSHPPDPFPGTVSAPEQLQDTVRRIWARMLGLDMDDLDEDWNFFELGGNSLSAVELTLELERALDTSLSGEEVYRYPTLRQLSRALQGEPPGDGSPVTLAQDVVLDEQIVPPPTDVCRRLQDASAIFLTGATGFLGAFLLDELLRATSDKVRVYCLVRGDSTEPRALVERIRETLHYYGLPSHDLTHRIVVVPGNLTQPRFGLDDDRYREVAEAVDLIFHCGAAVNYVYPYSVVKPHTVDGTREVLKLACSLRTKPLQYISSNGIFPGGDGARYTEDSDIDGYAEHLEGGYNQAKWVAERLVWKAAGRGLPVCVYRPGNIGHHSATGAANPNDFQTLILTACARTGYTPEAPGWYLEMTPVDFLACVVRGFSENPEHWGSVYHVVQETPLPADTVFAYLQDRGLVAGGIPLREWRQRVEEMSERVGDDRMKVVARSLDYVQGYLQDTSVYDCSRFNHAIARAGLARPQVDAPYVAKLLEHMLR